MGNDVRDASFDSQGNRRRLRGLYSRDRNATFRTTLVRGRQNRCARLEQVAVVGFAYTGGPRRDSQFLRKTTSTPKLKDRAILGIPGAEAWKDRESSLHPRHPA